MKVMFLVTVQLSVHLSNGKNGMTTNLF